MSCALPRSLFLFSFVLARNLTVFRGRSGGKNKAEVLSNELMNREIARDDSEFQVFEEIDR